MDRIKRIKQKANYLKTYSKTVVDIEDRHKRTYLVITTLQSGLLT